MPGEQRSSDTTQKLTQRLDIDFALQAAGLGVWELNPVTNQVLWDDRCRELFGLAKDNYLSYEQAIQYIQADDVDRVTQAVQRAMNPESNGLFDETYRTVGADDGQLRWVRFYGRSYFSETGKIYRFAGVAQDVTQPILAQQREVSTRLDSQRQQRIYEAIAGSTPDLMYVFDLNYRFIYANQALLAMWGSSWDDAIGNSLLENGYEPWHAQMHEREIDQVVATKQAIRGEVSFPHATLGKRIYDYVFAPVLNERNEVEAVAGTTRDITDIKRAEAALKASEERFRLFVTASSDVVYTMSADWRQMNLLEGKTFLAMTRKPSRNWLLEYIPVEDQRQVEAALEEAIAGKRVFELEHRIIRADGTIGWTISRAVPILDEQGHILEWFGSASDVTERKRAEQALRQSEERFRNLTTELEERVKTRTQALSQANADLKRSNENLQQFAYVASHDLQEPLRKIQSFSTLLTQQLDEELNATAIDHLQRITAAGARMSTLIKDLLTYSRISTQQQTFGPVSLDAIVAGVLNTLEWNISQSEARISVDALPIVSGDESQLGQLFQNLLTNAIKFVAPGQAPQIRIMYFQRSLNELPSGVTPSVEAPFYHQIEVEDSGIGFDEKYADRIFQVFQRLHGKNEYPGTGVGLAICQRVVENHGGAITARSKPGQGAAFSVYLPA
ncbi:PAS domain-containing sensor histidine kinase [Larkinella rosea]|uniref:histidine kinase n=1 Tax=Larkinella rosea TaxID=2025312 RepID=A0A3P1BVC6_9BACT|nr:PAS domain-containing sensor histidine kinase [Larkinella rosea]RRB04826.1 PAS domain-containing sensor histidine kinase [Larkinella rosea]